MSQPKIRFVLINRDRGRLAQFSEYEVFLGDEKIGTVAGGVDTHYSVRLGHRTVLDRNWTASTNDNRGTGAAATRREAVNDLLHLTDHLKCPDDGTCHHECLVGARPCFRVQCCAPLSGVFPDDVWPDDVLAVHGGEQ